MIITLAANEILMISALVANEITNDNANDICHGANDNSPMF